MTAKRFVDRGFWLGVIPKLECIRSYRFPVMNKKPRCQDVILTSTGVFSVCYGIHCQSVLILWHFDCSFDFFNFSLRGTQLHPKKPAFLRPIKSIIFLKYMPRLHLLPSRISKVYGPPDCGMSSVHLLPKILHLLKNFLRTLINWTLLMSDNLPERVQILGHAHILYGKTELSAVKYFAICSYAVDFS